MTDHDRRRGTRAPLIVRMRTVRAQAAMHRDRDSPAAALAPYWRCTS
jgi:hypothetical protein